MNKIDLLNHKIIQYGVNLVADLSRLNKSTISRYVNGERQYSLENFERVSAAIRSIEEKNLKGRVSAREATERVVAGEDWQIAWQLLGNIP